MLAIGAVGLTVAYGVARFLSVGFSQLRDFVFFLQPPITAGSAILDALRRRDLHSVADLLGALERQKPKH